MFDSRNTRRRPNLLVPQQKRHRDRENTASHGDDYQKAYEDVLERTSTQHAPWHVVAANRKWYRNVAIARTIVEALEGLEMKYPPAPDLTGIVIE